MNHYHLPVTVRRSIELLGLMGITIILIYGKSIVMPMLLALLFSVILLPVYRFFTRIRFPKILAITMCLLLLIVVVGGVVWFFSFQVGKLVSDFPQLKENITAHANNLSAWINEKTNFSTSQQIKLINEQSQKLMDQGGKFLGKAATSLTSTLTFVVLVPLFTFLFLLYKNLLLRFVYHWFPKKEHEKVNETLVSMESILKGYLIGLLIQITYMTILLGGILTLIGIDHAILIGIIFALLNLIPYVGAFIGNAIGVLLTLSSTQELWPVLAVLGTIAFVQFLDNNILMPRIVGSKVQCNAMATIGAVLIGGAIAGVGGMFLSLPIIAILKVIFERTEGFYHWSVLMGEDNPDESPIHNEAVIEEGGEAGEQGKKTG